MGASESPPAVRPETHPPPPGPSDSRATGAALGVGLQLERVRMLTLPHTLLTEHGGAGCLPPHPLQSGAGSQPSTCPAHEGPCPCHPSLSTPWHCAAHLLSASTSMQPRVQRFLRDQDGQPSAAHPNYRPECSPSASCRVPFGRRQGPTTYLHRHPCHPCPQGFSPQRLGLRELRGSWRHDMEKGYGQSGWLGRHAWKASGGWHGKSRAASSQPLELAVKGMDWGPCLLEENARLLPQP